MATLTLAAENGVDWKVAWAPGWGAKTATVTPRKPTRTAAIPAARTPAPDDAAWIARVQRGDETAASALATRLYPTIIKVVRSHLPRRTSEEDLAQAVYAKVFSKLHQFSGLVPLEHWVSRIAVNTCINQIKHESGRPELRMSDLSEEQEAVVQQLASTDEDRPGERTRAARELLGKLLAPLRPDERLVITLLHLEERSVQEIGRMTGWSLSLVKVKAFRARRKMLKLWNAFYKDHER